MSMAADEPIPPREFRGLRPLPQLIFSSRWLQLPLYLGLIVAQCVYVVLFVKELWHLVLGAMKFTEQEIMLVVLGLIDVVMISNLLIMVIVGGYETFVSRMELEKHPDQPEWLSHVNAGVMWQTIIHGPFILSAIGIAFVERLSQPVTGQRSMHA